MKNLPIPSADARLPVMGHDSKGTFNTRRPRTPTLPEGGFLKKADVVPK
jgi:hypothetical protein